MMFTIPRDMFEDMRRSNIRLIPYGPMKSDMIDKGDSFDIFLELPGYKKEDISIELKDGSLIVSAKKEEKKETDGKYVVKECFRGTAKRSFYFGDYLKDEDVNADFADGILTINVKKEPQPEVEAPKLIEIH